jgi:broad specificity phosphatase PhoE
MLIFFLFYFYLYLILFILFTKKKINVINKIFLKCKSFFHLDKIKRVFCVKTYRKKIMTRLVKHKTKKSKRRFIKKLKKSILQNSTQSLLRRSKNQKNGIIKSPPNQQQDFLSRIPKQINNLLRFLQEKCTNGYEKATSFCSLLWKRIRNLSKKKVFPRFRTSSSFRQVHSVLTPLIVILRHGERADVDPEKEEEQEESTKNGINLEDPPLTKRGYQTAREEGLQILQKISQKFHRSDDDTRKIKIRLVISPFLRCLQTGAAILESVVEKDEEFLLSGIIIDNQWCELFNLQVIKNCASEETGPVLASEPGRAIRDAIVTMRKQHQTNNTNNNNSRFEEILSRNLTVVNSLPSFGEVRDTGYYRFRSQLRELLMKMMMIQNQHDEDENENGHDDTCDVVIIVTHGDALNAIMMELVGPKRIVFNCEYLSHFFITSKRNEQFRETDDQDGNDNQETISSRMNMFLYLLLQQQNLIPLKFEIENICGMDWFDEE